MLTYAQLTTPPTKEQIFAQMIDKLRELGFTATAWQSGSIAYSILMVVAWLYAGLGQVVYTLTIGRYSETATGEWLTQLSYNEFDNERQLALSARHTVILTCEAGEGPYTFTAGELVVTDGERTFRDITGGTLTSGGTLSITVEDETASSAGNIAANTITQFVTSVVGVTCNNPAIGSTGTSITRYGLDQESDSRLKARNRTKMALMSTETTVDKIVAVILREVPAVEKVKVDDNNPRGAGTVDIYIAGRYAVSAAEDVTDAKTAIDPFFMNPTTRIQVIAATGLTLATSGTILCSSSVGAVTVQALLETGGGVDDDYGILKELLAELPIGGNSYTSGPTNIFPRNELIAAIENTNGVESLILTTPAANTTVPIYSVLLAPSSWGFTYTTTVVS